MAQKITLAAPYTDRAGKSHKADATVELPRDEASNLLHLGLAREPEQSESTKQAVKATEKKEG